MVNYKAVQVLRVGENEYFPGEVFEAIEDGRDWSSLVRFGQAVETTEKPTDKASHKKEAPKAEPPKEDLTNPVKSGIVTRKAEIREEGKGWLKVYDEKGQQIGKATRDEEEAELIKLEYETQPE